jgi:hypothetical protein
MSSLKMFEKMKERDLPLHCLRTDFLIQNYFLQIGAAIKKRLPQISTKLWNKGNPGSPASEEILEEIMSDCSIAIAGYGH